MTDLAPGIDPDTGADTDFGLLPVLRHYEEKRQYPRIDVRLPVIVTTPGHEVLQARVRNVCAEGVQIRCDRDTAARIQPPGRRPPPGAEPVLLLRFELQVGARRRPFAASARVCYVAAKSREEMVFGLEFTRLAAEARTLLSEYLDDCLRPAQAPEACAVSAA